MRRTTIATIAFAALLTITTALPTQAITLYEQTTASSDDGSGSYVTVTAALLHVSGWTPSCGGFSNLPLNQYFSGCLGPCSENYFWGVHACASETDVNAKANCCTQTRNVLVACLEGYDLNTRCN